MFTTKSKIEIKIKKNNNNNNSDLQYHRKLFKKKKNVNSV